MFSMEYAGLNFYGLQLTLFGFGRMMQKNILFLINNFFTNPRDYKLICICLQKVQMPKMFACHMVSTHMLCSLLQSEQLQIVWHHKDSLLV